jgi:alpha-tubulin suppressor-like RCC1 family protein
LTFTTIVGGDWHTCALNSSGDAYCWGVNDKGQLGNGSATGPSSSVPVAVAGALKFISLAATGDHTCGLVASGAAYCWGKNDFGQFGNGTRSNGSLVAGSTTPVPVSGGLRFSNFDAGGYHTCGIVSSGAAYCWGLNQSGQVGNGLQGTNVDALVPTAVSGALTFSAIFTGVYHSCALTTGGSAYCWGSNLYGGLGNGSASGPDNCPTYPNTGGCSVRPVGVAGGQHFNVLALGGYHTCGLVSDGIAYCWGANTNGQLGNGFKMDTSVPVGVIGSANFPSSLLFKSITAASTNYTCGIRTTGEAYCWGRNDVGQLGDGTTVDSSTPVAVSGWPPQG